jgi:hypothetical protein
VLATLLQANEEFVPTLLTFPVPVDDSNQLLPAVHGGAHHNQHALPPFLRVF